MDNAADMVAKGRQVKGDQHPFNKYLWLRKYGDSNGSRKHPERLARGERNWKTHLTWADVCLIRKEYADGYTTQCGLAGRFKVTQSCIWAIVTHKTWDPKYENIAQT